MRRLCAALAAAWLAIAATAHAGSFDAPPASVVSGDGGAKALYGNGVAINPLPDLGLFLSTQGVIQSAGTLSSWQNQVANANCAALTPPAAAPTYTASASQANNLPAILFASASSQYLTCPSYTSELAFAVVVGWTTPPATSGQAQTFLSVDSSGSTPAAYYLLGDTYTGSSAQDFRQCVRTTTTETVTGYGWKFAKSGTPVYGALDIFGCAMSGRQVNTWRGPHVDGGTEGIQNPSTTLSTVAGPLAIGAGYNSHTATWFLNGGVVAVLLYSYVPTESQLLQIMEGLQAAYAGKPGDTNWLGFSYMAQPEGTANPLDKSLLVMKSSDGQNWTPAHSSFLHGTSEVVGTPAPLYMGGRVLLAYNTAQNGNSVALAIDRGNLKFMELPGTVPIGLNCGDASGATTINGMSWFTDVDGSAWLVFAATVAGANNMYAQKMLNPLGTRWGCSRALTNVSAWPLPAAGGQIDPHIVYDGALGSPYVLFWSSQNGANQNFIYTATAAVSPIGPYTTQNKQNNAWGANAEAPTAIGVGTNTIGSAYWWACADYRGNGIFCAYNAGDPSGTAWTTPVEITATPMPEHMTIIQAYGYRQ